MRMEAAVYEDIVRSLRARAWGDLDTMQEEMGREFPAVAAQSIRSILYQAWRWRCFYLYCEAQGKGRAKGRPRKVTQRSFMDGGWWMVDILSLMLYIKFGCHHPKVS